MNARTRWALTLALAALVTVACLACREPTGLVGPVARAGVVDETSDPPWKHVKTLRVVITQDVTAEAPKNVREDLTNEEK